MSWKDLSGVLEVWILCVYQRDYSLVLKRLVNDYNSLKVVGQGRYGRSKTGAPLLKLNKTKLYHISLAFRPLSHLSWESISGRLSFFKEICAFNNPYFKRLFGGSFIMTLVN